MRFLALALIVFLAGCSGRGSPSTGPVEAGEATYVTEDFPKPMPVEWVHLAEGDFHLGSVTGMVHRAPLAVPNGTLHLDVNLTFAMGATVDPRILFDTCDLQLNGTIAATGQTIPFDCGRVHDVTGELVIAQREGDVMGRFTVDAMLCGRPGQRYGCG